MVVMVIVVIVFIIIVVVIVVSWVFFLPPYSHKFKEREVKSGHRPSQVDRQWLRPEEVVVQGRVRVVPTHTRKSNFVCKTLQSAHLGSLQALISRETKIASSFLSSFQCYKSCSLLGNF